MWRGHCHLCQRSRARLRLTIRWFPNLISRSRIGNCGGWKDESGRSQKRPCPSNIDPLGPTPRKRPRPRKLRPQSVRQPKPKAQSQRKRTPLGETMCPPRGTEDYSISQVSVDVMSGWLGEGARALNVRVLGAAWSMHDACSLGRSSYHHGRFSHSFDGRGSRLLFRTATVAQRAAPENSARLLPGASSRAQSADVLHDFHWDVAG